jgi:hypothetical protein
VLPVVKYLKEVREKSVKMYLIYTVIAAQKAWLKLRSCQQNCVDKAIKAQKALCHCVGEAVQVSKIDIFNTIHD